MNATETIFALALASNLNPQYHFQHVFSQIQNLGSVQFSPIYLIPCRDGVGEDYWNAACLLKSTLSVDALTVLLKQLEIESGRLRPSHQIALDIDLIACGGDLNHMQFNPKKLPLAWDVKIPMLDLWSIDFFKHEKHQFPIIVL